MLINKVREERNKQQNFTETGTFQHETITEEIIAEQGTTSEANAPKNKQVREPSDEDESLPFNEDTGTEYHFE